MFFKVFVVLLRMFCNIDGNICRLRKVLIVDVVVIFVIDFIVLNVSSVFSSRL